MPSVKHRMLYTSLELYVLKVLGPNTERWSSGKVLQFISKANLCVWIYDQISMCRHVCQMHVTVEVRGQHSVSSSIICFFIFGTRISHWMWSSPIRLHWLVNELQGSIYIYPSCPSTTVWYLLLLLALFLGHRDLKLAHLVLAASFTTLVLMLVLKGNF